MNTSGSGIKLITGNANPELAQKVAKIANIPLCNSEVGTFSDGEIYVNIYETVRGADVFVFQPTSPPVNNHLLELLIMIDALKRASAGRITAVLPYFAYARQDRIAKPREPIAAKVVADLLTVAGADRILAMDLHAPQIQGFFNIPVDHLLGMPVLVRYILKKGLKDPVIVSPDFGSVTRARTFAKYFRAPIAIIDRRKMKGNISEAVNVIGSVEDKTAVLIDDMVDTGENMSRASGILKEFGAKEIYACCTHPILSDSAVEKISESPIKELIVTDTIAVPEEKRIEKIKIVSIAGIFADAILRIYNNISVSRIFD